MPQYSERGKPFVGTLVFRADLFEQRGLRWDTWEQLYDSLQQLKASFPKSRPFGITGDDLLYRAASWFGSGHDRTLVAITRRSASVWGRGIRRTTCAGSLAHTATDCCT